MRAVGAVVAALVGCAGCQSTGPRLDPRPAGPIVQEYVLDPPDSAANNRPPPPVPPSGPHFLVGGSAASPPDVIRPGGLLRGID